MTPHYITELVSLCFLAFAISMDAFSVSLGLGLHRPRLKRIAIIGLLIGLLHIMLPFLGIIVGQLISVKVGYVTAVLGGFLLVGIGAHMLFSAFNSEPYQHANPVGLALFSLAFIVSIDSFSVGLSLGMSGVKVIFALLLFGTVSMVMTWLGMLIGRKVHGYLGVYSEILGGGILVGFGLYVLFG